MAKILKTYDPRDVYVIWSEIGLDSGFAPDTFLSILPDAEVFNTVSGIGGKVARITNGVQTATIKVSLMQNSDANKQLMKKLNEVVFGDNGDLAPMTITDKSKTILVRLEDCFIESIPEFSLGETYTSVEWTFRAKLISGLDVEDTGNIGISSIFGGII